MKIVKNYKNCEEMSKNSIKKSAKNGENLLKRNPDRGLKNKEQKFFKNSMKIVKIFQKRVKLENTMKNRKKWWKSKEKKIH